MSTLLSVGDLMGQSWQFFASHWKPLLKRASWLLVVFVLYIVLAIPATMNEAWGAYAVLLVLYVLGMLVAMNHLYLYIAKENGSSSVHLNRRAIDLLPPTLVIVILSLIVHTIAFMVFIIPAIWLGVSLAFAHLLLLEDDRRGVSALRASYDLVKGRWFATLWRMLLPTLALMIAIWAVSMVIWVIIGVVGGGSLFAIFFGLSGEAGRGASVAGGFLGLLVTIVVVVAGLAAQLAAMFVAFCYPAICHIKLFHSLKETKSSAPVQP